MPYISNSIIIETREESQDESNTYSYSTLTLADDLDEASQLELRWEVAQVELPDQVVETFIQVSDLSATVREQLWVVGQDYYTVNVGAQSVTILPTLDELRITTTDTDGTIQDYVLPTLAFVSAASPIKIRRSINITTPTVDFQPGGRLTSAQLNAGLQQVLYATQELLSFGAGANQDTPDLSALSINQLGDVAINFENDGALLIIEPDGVIRETTSVDFGAVLSVNGDTGVVVLDWNDVGAAKADHTHTVDEITDFNNLGIDSLDDVDTTTVAPDIGDTLTWTGTAWVPSTRVTTATGTGPPPTAWTNDPARLAGDLYIRTG